MATWGGVGYAPVASGTVASAVALVLLWLIPFSAPALAWAVGVVTAVGLWAGGRVERVLGQKDPGIIVVDEVAGMALSVLFLPRTIPVLLVAFFLFRLFDVWKPFPARESQALAGGLGVMIDDLVAGVYALVLVMGARALFGVPA
ncbi:MAG TPA: phosphatidylglycerophosphatase A [Verrucomicrobiae bacterium]|nr:phosphatidylglycerophosphatase A [Verrucomicrobiae bacterium]